MLSLGLDVCGQGAAQDLTYGFVPATGDFLRRRSQGWMDSDREGDGLL